MNSMGGDDLHENHDDQQYEAFDDISGAVLDPALVSNARKEELEYFKSMKVYEYAPLSECWDQTGHAPIGTKWIDVNKGDTDKLNYRSRLVAK